MKIFIKGVYVDLYAVTHIEKKENELVLHFLNSTKHTFVREKNVTASNEELEELNLILKSRRLVPVEHIFTKENIGKPIPYIKHLDDEDKKALDDSKYKKMLEKEDEEWKSFVRTVTHNWGALESAIKEIKVMN